MASCSIETAAPSCSTCSPQVGDCASCISKPTTEVTSLKEYVGILDIFKIGLGPSSSHTMGPMWAGKRFAETVLTNYSDRVAYVDIHLYGSLALTGKGHATDKACVLGLAGYQPDTVNPDTADESFNEICEKKRLPLNGAPPLPFDIEKDLIFHYDIALPLHPNGMTLRAFDKPFDGSLLFEETFYSTGGGFIKTEKELAADLEGTTDAGSPTSSSGGETTSAENSPPPVTGDDASPSSTKTAPPAAPGVPYNFQTATELVHFAQSTGMTIAEIMIQNECVLKQLTREQVYEKLDVIAAVMDSCVERGLRMEGRMPVTNAPRRSAQIRRRLNKNMERNLNDPLTASDWIALYARAVNEENACGGRVVTAPTNGASGTIPAVLTYYRRSVPIATKQGVRDFLATAGAVGSLCKRNASISGAEAGCQAEVGSACSMAAAGLAAVLGGSLSQIENAAEIALEHCLGMTCDPVLGLVQIPCIERNCVAAIKAVMSCRLALMGDGEHEVSLDSCIETMYRTGLDMQAKYRETSTGGLAIFARKVTF